jgi:hypothetical protein
MNRSPYKSSAISRLLALFKEPRHDYRPTTDLFLDLDVNRVADEFRLAKRGQERGSQNRPSKDAQTLDDIEHHIIDRVEVHKQDAQRASPKQPFGEI